MKIQCNVCEKAEATVLCCADEAALCWSCDEKVHAANKLASKHQRLVLSTSGFQMPKCDICQETVGFFFCLEDRALLCRKCDVAIHTVNSFVSSHQRFLLTGVKVGNETADDLGVSLSSRNSQTTKRIVPLPSTHQNNKPVPVQAVGADDFAPPSLPFAGGSSPDGVQIQQWQFDEFLGLSDLDQNYNYDNHVSTKGFDAMLCRKLGGSDCSLILRAMEDELDGEGFGQVPDASWAVQEICSPVTDSGLWWPKSHDHNNQFHKAAFVPDVCYSPMSHLYPFQQSASSLKRRRQF